MKSNPAIYGIVVEHPKADSRTINPLLNYSRLNVSRVEPRLGADDVGLAIRIFAKESHSGYLWRMLLSEDTINQIVEAHKFHHDLHKEDANAE